MPFCVPLVGIVGTEDLGHEPFTIHMHIPGSHHRSRVTRELLNDSRRDSHQAVSGESGVTQVVDADLALDPCPLNSTFE